LYKKVLCDACAGTGAQGKEMKTCETCKGSGKVQKTARSIFGTFSQVVVCHECGGKGSVPKSKCRKCGGEGVVRDYQKISVVIPAGIEDGQTMRVTGQGEAPKGGGRPGNLYVNIHVKEHFEFSRKDRDIVSEKKVTFSQAALGDKVDVSTIDGLVKIKIPAGTQSGDVLKIRNKGIGDSERFGRGDHLVKIQLQTPESLSRGQKELLRQLRGSGI
jgi:molecular chaperone DnaJ